MSFLMKKLVPFQRQAISVKLASAGKMWVNLNFQLISGLLLLEYYRKNGPMQEVVFVLWIYLPALNNWEFIEYRH